MTEPISPKDVGKAKAATIPDHVIEAANELIAKNWDGYSAIIMVGELCALARAKGRMPAGQQFGDGELDIEHLYRRHGWNVKFDRPDEAYEANWTFRKGRSRRSP